MTPDTTNPDTARRHPSRQREQQHLTTAKLWARQLRFRRGQTSQAQVSVPRTKTRHVVVLNHRGDGAARWTRTSGVHVAGLDQVSRATRLGEQTAEQLAVVSSRPTIRDVAKAAGVSIAIVSYALNGRPGVSATTRDRVLRVADEYGWRPSTSARSVRSGPRAVGLAVSQEPGSLARAGAFLDFLNAASEVVATGGLALAMQVVDSVAVAAETYRQWWAERRFDLVIVPDLLADDPRVGVPVSYTHLTLPTNREV